MMLDNSRVLTDRERAAILQVLSASIPGTVELRRQVPLAQVIGNWGDGSPSIDIHVPDSAARAAVGDGPLPITAEVLDDRGGYVGELILWVASGAISALEYAWVTDEMPAGLPDASSVRVSAP